jgi:hypothetical protein
MKIMPLSNNTIIRLNEITTQVYDKKNLTDKDEQLIRDVFIRTLESGEYYDVDEIEAWFENEGSWKHRPTIVRITNISHYVQARFEQGGKKLRVISDHDDDCSCH